MFQSVEKPIVHFYIPKHFSETYFHNIIKIMQHPDFDTVLIECESILSKTYQSELKRIIADKNKTFFIQSPETFDDCGNENVLLSTSVLAEDIHLMDPGRYQVVFIQFDISKEYSQYNWQALSNFIEHYPQSSFFISFVVTGSGIIQLHRCSFILDKLLELDARFFLTPLFKNTALVVEHPCNAYLCDGAKCHSKKSPYPKYLYFTPDGAYPYICIDNRIAFLRDISSREIADINDIFLKYKESTMHQVFISCNKSIFQNYILPQVSSLFAWNIMLQYTLQTNDCQENII